MSSVATLSRPSYQERIQNCLDLYSSTHLDAKNIIADMNKIPETYQSWISSDSESKIPVDQMIQQLMSTYHTAIQAQKAGSQLLQQLQEVFEICKNIRLSANHHEINFLLSQHPKYAMHIQKQGEAFVKVTEHLDLLAKKTETHFLQIIKDRLPTVQNSIEECLKIAHPQSMGEMLWQWVGWSAPSIETAYQAWKETETEDKKNWQLDTISPNVYQPRSAEEIEKGNELHQALKKFNLNWVDPETMHHHGAQLKPESENNPSSEDKDFLAENLALSMLFPEAPANIPSTNTAEMETVWIPTTSQECQGSNSKDLNCANPTENISSQEIQEKENSHSSPSEGNLSDNLPGTPNPLSSDSPDVLPNPTGEPSPFLLDPSSTERLDYNQPASDDLKNENEIKKEEKQIIAENSDPKSSPNVLISSEETKTSPQIEKNDSLSILNIRSLLIGKQPGRKTPAGLKTPIYGKNKPHQQSK